MLYTLHYEDGRVSRGVDITEAARITGLCEEEIVWAIEDTGSCAVEVEGLGEVVVMPE